MKSNYRRIGDFIELVDVRNKELKVTTLLGLSISKQFIPSVANTVGTNMKNYKIIKRNQFACSIMQVRRDRKMPVALLKDFDEAIISQAYPVFEIIKPAELLPDYLMMWFTRSEFDRHAEFLAVGGVRGSLEWEDFLDMTLPVPSLEKQQEIVDDYTTVQDRIRINEELNTALEETAQALYKHWFVDFEFPINVSSSAVENDLNHSDSKTVSTALDMTKVKGYKSSGGAMVYNEELDQEIPVGWEVDKLELLCSKIASGSTPKGGKEAYLDKGISLIRSMNVYDFKFKSDDLAFISDYQAFKLKNVEIRENDILFNITGASVARCCIVPNDILPARINQHVMIIRPSNSKYNNYLLMFLCSAAIKQKLVGVSEAGSTRQAITKGDIENIKVLIPSKKVLENFDSTISIILNRRRQLTSNNSELKLLTNVLLSKMATVEDEEEIKQPAV